MPTKANRRDVLARIWHVAPLRPERSGRGSGGTEAVTSPGAGRAGDGNRTRIASLEAPRSDRVGDRAFEPFALTTVRRARSGASATADHRWTLVACMAWGTLGAHPQGSPAHLSTGRHSVAA